MLPAFFSPIILHKKDGKKPPAVLRNCLLLTAVPLFLNPDLRLLRKDMVHLPADTVQFLLLQAYGFLPDFFRYRTLTTASTVPAPLLLLTKSDMHLCRIPAILLDTDNSSKKYTIYVSIPPIHHRNALWKTPPQTHEILHCPLHKPRSKSALPHLPEAYAVPLLLPHEKTDLSQLNENNSAQYTHKNCQSS